MKAESIVFAVAGMCFGVILGWVLATQKRIVPSRFCRPQAPAAAAPAPNRQRQAPPLDEARVQTLRSAIENDPKNAESCAQLGNTYFDAERWPTPSTPTSAR